MKKTILFSAIVLLMGLNLNSQNYFVCQTPPGPPLQGPPQPSTCTQILRDLAPTNSDRSIEVNVNFWVFVPTTNSATSVWAYNPAFITPTNAQICLDLANATYTNIPLTPKLTQPGIIPVMTDATIKLVLKTFSIVPHNAGYNDITDVSNGSLGLGWHDPAAINLFFGDFPGGGGVIGVPLLGLYPSVYPGNAIHFSPAFYKQTTPQVYDNIAAYGKELAHEVGHILGLNHPSIFTNPPGGESPSYVLLSAGCCSAAAIEDVFMETYPCFLCITNQGCAVPGASDNLMSSNSGCNRYLSPQQAAVMHYNLRTFCIDFLSLSGYTAATTANTAFNYSVTNHETWQGGDRYFKGNIIVKAGKTLTIKCAVAMTRGASIIVEKTAQLVIDGGKITNISGRTWDGIVVVGDPTKNQLIDYNGPNPGAAFHQGMLRLKNGGTIERALIGARADAMGGAGGIIIAQNSNFYDNEIDVHFRSYYYKGQTPFASASRFFNCNFKTLAYTYGTNYYGDIITPRMHAYLYKILGVGFYGCTFKNTAQLVAKKGFGIFSTDASYVVDKNGNTPCIFENLERGVYVNNGNPLYVPSINNSKFINNWAVQPVAPYGFAAYIFNANYLTFNTNTVQVAGNFYSEGLYLNTNRYYKVKGNTFLQSSGNAKGPGTQIFRSKTGAHEVYGNKYSDLWMGINCIDDNGNANNPNDGLKMNCNIFNASPNLYDVLLTRSSNLYAPPKVLVNQGEINQALVTSTNVVRNIYGAACNNNQNKWQIHPSSTVTINHGSNSNTVTAVTQPTATGCKSSLLNVVGFNLPLNYSSHCPGSTASSGGNGTTQSQKLENLNTYISALKASNEGNIHHFEIQSSVASKLNLFLSDTLEPAFDSVINILENNHGNMEDADIQTVFAYMLKADYATAKTKAENLGTNRADWKELLKKLIDLEKDTVQGIFGLNSNTNVLNTFNTYAAAEDKDGQWVAQAILLAACDSVYTEPHTYPEGEAAPRMMNSQPEAMQETNIENENLSIRMFPNPTKSGINLYYHSTSEGVLNIEVKDLLGKVIYTNFMYSRAGDIYIPLNQLSGGMYLLSLSQNQRVIYTSKIIKKD